MATVLVVDDESDIRELLVDTLLDAGFQVIEAANGQSGLDRAFKDRPNIILLDIWMPGMDGYEVLWRLKEKPDTQDLPVILLTAVPASDGEQIGMELGVSHYISKPWEPGVVEAVVRVVLAEAGNSAYNPEADDGEDDGELDTGNMDVGADKVDIKSTDAQIFNMQSGMAKLRRSRKKTIADDDGEDEKPKLIRSGGKLVALERAMDGGIAMGSLVLAVGSASSGKSVLCQHLTYGALEEGSGAAFFSSSHTPESFEQQMTSLGLNVSEHIRSQKLGLFGVPEATQGEEAEPLLAELGLAIERLSLGAQFIAIDSLTDLAGFCSPQAVMAFFTKCRRLGNMGRTIFIVIDSYAFDTEMFTRLRSLCDGYFTLGSEMMQGKQLRVLEVNKINTTELQNANALSFEVDPGVGMRLTPISKVKV